MFAHAFRLNPLDLQKMYDICLRTQPCETCATVRFSELLKLLLTHLDTVLAVGGIDHRGLVPDLRRLVLV